MQKFFILVSISLLHLTFLNGQSVNLEQFSSLKIRNVGPAGMSGRVTAVDVVHKNPDVIYVGTASGGLWKSTGGGITWTPIFDKEKSHSIGAIAIYQKSPDIIWVGTGEGNPRNSQNMGNGVYRSLDGGATWQHMGLENTRVIHRIFVHPDNPDIVWVGAQGQAWADTPDRGVYKTTDGGKTWRKVLFVNNRTGVADMVMDPQNPNKLICGMWEFRRWPWYFKSGGAGSGLYVSLDGGETWTQRTKDDGLPEGEIGKIGIAIANSNPEVVYALIESKKNALYKSVDGGRKWSFVQSNEVGDRPFYYFDVHVDPQNEHLIYDVFSNVKMSIDGGKTYQTLLGWDRVHGDHHFWYVHPHDGSYLIDGNDGGLAISRDRGKTWQFVENLPVGQFYHVSVDDAIPYNVLGGMQDNGSWRGPSNSLRNGGLRNGYWDEVAFGDGFDVLAVPGDNRYGYGMWQGGNLQYLDYETGFNQYIKPTHPEGTFLRFNWNAAIAQDPFDANTIYYGSQFLHKSTDRGQNWTIISGDLTTNDKEKQNQMTSGGLTFDVTGAENHCTILAIAPSALDKNTIWVGTDDGNVQLTRDGGKTWTLVSGNIKGLPKGAWMPQIHASKHQAAEAFVVVNDYRRGNWTPMIYQTRDFGKTWKNLVSEQSVYGYTLSFVQDPVEPKLMFAGTEYGLYVSIDAGATWTRWTDGFPTVPVIDLVIHPREHDLVIGTFGRSIWILDDIRPLRELATKGTKILQEPIYAFSTPDAYLFSIKEAAGTRFMADAIYRGEDRPYGALLSYSIKATPKQDTSIKSDTVKITITNEKGEVVRKLYQIPQKQGVQRFSWYLDAKGERYPGQPKATSEFDEPGGFNVLPGKYNVSFAYAGGTSVTTVMVKPDPRQVFDAKSAIELNEKRNRSLAIQSQAISMLDSIADALKTIQSVNQAIAKNAGGNDEIKKQGSALEEKLKEIKYRIVSKDDVQGIYDDPYTFSSLFFAATYQLSGTYMKPNANQDFAMHAAVKKMEEIKKDFRKVFEEDWAAYQKAASSMSFSPFDWK